MQLRRRLFPFILSITFMIVVLISVVSCLSHMYLLGAKEPVWPVFLSLVASAFFVWLSVYHIERNFNRSLKKLEEGVNSVNKVRDLTKVRFEAVDFGFYDLNRIRDELVELVEKLKKVAIDKDVLEFELKLLEEFVLTPEIIRDWKGFLRRVFEKMRSLLKSDVFFVAFSEDKLVNVVVFSGTKTRRELEELLTSCVRDKFSEKSCTVKFLYELLPEGTSTLKDLKVIQKSSSLKRPNISVCAGLGLKREVEEDSATLLIAEGFLALAVNLLISVKAVESYTRSLEYYATRDPLTGLYNRRMFYELLNAELEKAQRRNYKVAVVFVDLDNFKLVNDAYGHEFGDKLLSTLAQVIRESFRREDTVARYGGDEFVALLPYVDAEKACAVARRVVERLISTSVRAPDGKLVAVSCSVGIAVYPDHALSANDLLFLADRMMYKAKLSGKNRIALPGPEELECAARERETIHFIVLDALQRRKVKPYFQPIVNATTGRVESFEVLMRIEENGKVISANEFIPVAERSGLIDQLEKILIENAFEKMKTLPKNLSVFFNLSPRTLVKSDFVEWFSELIEEFDCCPASGRVVIELTERETVRNIELLVTEVKRLRDAGVRFALDDFGSGFSSYRYLKHIPVDFIKIEGEFVRSMLSHEIDKAFVVSAITMAEQLGIKTIAEFVENESILKRLRELGVDYVQGYFIGKPEPDPVVFLEKTILRGF